MKRKIKAPPKPTQEEKVLLSRFLSMPGWHFDATIKIKCSEIDSYTIEWTKDDWIKAIVYGLEAVKTETKESCIANLFVRYKYRVYQVDDISKVIGLIELIKKEAKYEKYRDKMWEKKFKERQKAIAQKEKSKVKVKKLKTETKKRAA